MEREGGSVWRKLLWGLDSVTSKRRLRWKYSVHNTLVTWSMQFGQFLLPPVASWTLLFEKWSYSNARGWCTGKTQRDRVEREVGGGSGWGIHVNPWLIHVSVWQKPLQYCKVISLQLIKINEKKKVVLLKLQKHHCHFKLRFAASWIFNLSFFFS